MKLFRLLNRADLRNHQAALRAIQELEDVFERYKGNVGFFVDDLMSTWTRLRIAWRMPGNWWYQDNRIEKMVAEKLETHLFRFIERNPGKVLFTAAATTIILQNADGILGGQMIEYDAEGNPIYVPMPGMAERLLAPFVPIMAIAVMIPAVIFLLVWSAIHLWFTYKRKKRKYAKELKGCHEYDAYADRTGGSVTH